MSTYQPADEIEVSAIGPDDDRTIEVGKWDPYEPGYVHEMDLTEEQARELHAKLGALLGLA